MVKESELPILEIYHPSISAGDTAIIVTRDSNQNIINCVLIDLGCNTEEFIKWCEENISGFTMDKESTFDYVIVSHYHTDHYAGVNHKSIQTKCFISSHVSDKTRISKLNRNANKFKRKVNIINKYSIKRYFLTRYFKSANIFFSSLIFIF